MIHIQTMIGLKGVRRPIRVDNFAVLVRLRAQGHACWAPLQAHPDVACMWVCCVLLRAEPDGADAVVAPQQDAAAAVQDSKDADRTKSGEDAEKAARDLEEESYRQMQNFDDYSKTIPKGKLTLASLLGKGTSNDEAPQTAAGDEAADEEYYEEGEGGGEDDEYYEGEEGEYYEEYEAAPLPEVEAIPPT